MPETEISAETKTRADELARKISGYLADGEPVIVELPSAEQESILYKRFEELFGDVEVIQILNLENEPEVILQQMVQLNLLEKDAISSDESDDVVTYSPIDVVFGDVPSDIVEEVGKQHYFIVGLSSFATTTNFENSDAEEGRQADRNKFSVALGVRQAMKTGRAFSIIFTEKKTASDYYHQNITMQRMMDELIPPPPKTQVIKNDLN